MKAKKERSFNRRGAFSVPGEMKDFCSLQKKYSDQGKGDNRETVREGLDLGKQRLLSESIRYITGCASGVLEIGQSGIITSKWEEVNFFTDY